jgi:hypothetical protein
LVAILFLLFPLAVLGRVANAPPFLPCYPN